MHRVETPCYLFGSPPFPAASFALQGQSTGSCSPHGFSAVVVVGSVPTVTCVVTLHSFFLFTHPHTLDKQRTNATVASLSGSQATRVFGLNFFWVLSLSLFFRFCLLLFSIDFSFPTTTQQRTLEQCQQRLVGLGVGVTTAARRRTAITAAAITKAAVVGAVVMGWWWQGAACLASEGKCGFEHTLSTQWWT